MATNDNSSSKFTKFDRNRFRKIYPINRFPASESFRSTAEVNIESVTVQFTGGNSANASLNNNYKALPVIMVAPKVPNIEPGPELNTLMDQANVNLYITSLTLNAGKVNFVIESSADYSGQAVVTVVSLA